MNQTTRKELAMARATVSIVDAFYTPNRTLELSIKIEMADLMAKMGNSSFVIKHTAGSLVTPRLKMLNGAYGIPSTKPVLYDAPYLLMLASGRNTILQLRHVGGARAAIIPEKSLLATIEWTVMAQHLELTWNELDSGLVQPDYSTIETLWQGGFRI
jgi:hypothetical protein